MIRMQKNGDVEIWQVAEQFDCNMNVIVASFYVYQRDKLVRVCPSMGMAREVAASVLA